ncbi:3-keto-5-aminohexanoate cleavage protein [Polymorphum gilvum]|uniref:Aminotransferase class-III n=1 Tax=Polymorphum gilvum (strain LMG 25793 / CGMCC 1.9160 / SL003B-26A1) TaxID=991905 RepID=F2J4T2_POLGS|nr:3-keto-5-aminohexanoate cleavage protein [Polymorphum gilvum]ADZ69024.1 Aminotransferase class-III [Polymorphum gilvum SL003B-26A1]
MIPLPTVMVAPNGARRTKADHPALPVTIPEIVATAAACHAEGAGAIHAHVRDAAGRHVLDAGLYLELMSELGRTVPQMLVQITTEAVDIYTPEQQRALVRAVRPAAVSVALREMVPDVEEEPAAGTFYAETREAGIAVQHILYDVADLRRFLALAAAGVVPGPTHQVLFVLGRYAVDQQSAPADLDPFLAVLDTARATSALPALDWAVCAFGRHETECLVSAVARGGKARIGFENSLWNADGSLARDNAERVRELVGRLRTRALP